jgi:hypothetical protein
LEKRKEIIEKEKAIHFSSDIVLNQKEIRADAKLKVLRH